MKTLSLCKIEWYRFIHSFEIIKYFVLIPAVLFAMCFINIYKVKNNGSASIVWNSTSSIYIYMLVAICVVIAIYVGREFQYKTINYEIMKGYGYVRIALAKTIFCGILVPIILILFMGAYLFFMSDTFAAHMILRIILLFVLLVHICSSTVLYILICKSGIIGGIIVIIRFYLLEVFKQWCQLINVDVPLTSKCIISVIGITVLEYIVLMILYSKMDKVYNKFN